MFFLLIKNKQNKARIETIVNNYIEYNKEREQLI